MPVKLILNFCELKFVCFELGLALISRPFFHLKKNIKLIHVSIAPLLQLIPIIFAVQVNFMLIFFLFSTIIVNDSTSKSIGNFISYLSFLIEAQSIKDAAGRC